jgi:hypothetical protein
LFTINRNSVLSTIIDNKHRAAAAVAGLALFGGLAISDASTSTHTPAQGGVAAPISTTQEQSTQQGTVHAKPAKPVSPKAQVPSSAALMPNGVPSDQVSFEPNAEQKANAEQIIKTGEGMHLSPRAQVIAVATSLQETHLNNYGHLGDTNDHDSLGLFQQRPSSGWGTPEQLVDPTYASTAYYTGLTNVPGYESMPLTDAAQAVQVSAYPDAYAKWETMAANIVHDYHVNQR